MKFIRWIFFALLVTGGAPLRMAAQTPQLSHAHEFQNCLDQFSVCNPTALNAQERQAVQRVAQDRNLRNCIYGFADCEKKQLNAEQQEEVARANDPPRACDRCSRGLTQARQARVRQIAAACRVAQSTAALLFD
jgi:hypothetical protein